MLSRLFIKNYALISHLDLEYINGFTTITGQTGSGKSIMLGALSMVLGSRVDSSVILNNTEKCIIEAHFNLDNDHIKKQFEKLDVDFEQESIFRREINLNGKSRAFINDMPVSLAIMKELGEELIDIHSQHQTLKLNKPEYQLQILDLFAGNSQLLRQYQKTYFEWKRNKIELAALLVQKENAIREHDFVQFQLNELIELGLEDKELSSLEEKFELLSSSMEIIDGLNHAEDLMGGESGILDQLKSIIARFETINQKHADLAEIGNRLNSIKIELDDILNESNNFRSNVEFDPKEAELIQSRMDQLNQLFYKHRVSSLQELIEIKSNLELKANETLDLDNRIEIAESEIDNQQIKLSGLSNELENRREKASKLLESRCHSILKDLQMKNVRLSFEISQLEEFNSSGMNKVALNFSPDNGKNFLPIQKVASGGEVSRVMLAVKSQLAKKAALPTIIFDEIDTGVSGEVASNTAAILKSMSMDMQVIAITHLPQVAAMGEVQLLVSKEEIDHTPLTKISILDKDSRVREIAKMLSASDLTEEAMANARVLLEN